MASVVLLGLLAVLVAAWPIAWMLAALHSAVTGQWLRIAKLCLLVPLWAITPMLALAELGPYIAAPDAPEPTGDAMRLVRLLVATAADAAAWWLLVAWLRQKPEQDAAPVEGCDLMVKL